MNSYNGIDNCLAEPISEVDLAMLACCRRRGRCTCGDAGAHLRGRGRRSSACTFPRWIWLRSRRSARRLSRGLSGRQIMAFTRWAQSSTGGR
eukprot:8904279-Pyramimonas_sp.AAC.1